MNFKLGVKTSIEHWDNIYNNYRRLRLPSPFNISSQDIKLLFKKHIKSGMRILEVGCAPGRNLAWIAKSLKADVSGVDYSQHGITLTSELFKKFGLYCDLRHEDIFNTTFPMHSFDVVYSFGLIEHFDDPGEIINMHIKLTKPGGITLIGIPNYTGLYGFLQRKLDPDNLAIHNTKIMNPGSLSGSVLEGAKNSTSYYYGRLSPWYLSFNSKMPRVPSRIISLIVNFMGFLQPIKIDLLCPMLVLEIKA